MIKTIIAVFFLVSLSYSQAVDWSNQTVNFPTSLDDTTSLIYADDGDIITSALFNKLLRVVRLIEEKIGLGSDTLSAARQVLIGQDGDSSLWRALEAADIPDLSGTYQSLGTIRSIKVTQIAPADNQILKWDAAADSLKFEADNASAGGSDYADSLVHDSRRVTGDSMITDAEGNARFLQLSAIRDSVDAYNADSVGVELQGFGLIRTIKVTQTAPTDNYILKWDAASDSLEFEADAGGGSTDYADSLTHDGRRVTGDSMITDAEGAARYQPLESTLTDIADGTINENLVNTASPWVDNEVADNITASNYVLLTAVDDSIARLVADSSLLPSADIAAAYQPLEATLTDIADGTIVEDLVNTTNPWSDEEVADDITASDYQPLEATLTDIADGTIAENLVNTANPWADNEVANDLTIVTDRVELDTLAGQTGNAFFMEDTLDGVSSLKALDSVQVGSDGTYVWKFIKSGTTLLIVTAADTFIVDSVRAK